MKKIVPYDFKKKTNESISLSSWIDCFRDEEEMRQIFLNMDRAMKYIHERGYCINSFDPKMIEILNNSVNQIKFLEIAPMPSDSIERKKMIKEDIYNSSFIQIGLYSNCLSYLKKDFLKSNFNSFAQFLPVDDIPYYRGVIDRGASVYYCEYTKEKINRDLAGLEQELSSATGGKGLVKGAGRSLYDDTGINDHINDAIYKNISGKRDAAFVSFLLFPTALLVLGVIISILVWIV